ncbi:CDP-6-deoxy-delta-3,4-glucoseen reductase [Curvibacter sp. APW13]|uniref:CDP-6-deoxy-delta-3,4-glucoseen reductase n=1 Tax=Curvibacter sp. APW13 TaxID=3077236 RepID=UPI0028DDA395|nr:CDP-6-deoxy-delta-3,4-glucoseen reductase [Curvibacter sp. APW13]MDT8992332.1 CDP-6-deoxy-delta-3,4-glucoseen reductase [Curvibacter sp. APW13]
MSTEGAASTGFTVTIAPSGRNFSTQGSDTILQAGIAAGINLPYGCKDGACGSCKCMKLSGTVQHNPHQAKALSAEEEAAGWVLTCSAHATSDVVLESKQVTELGALPIKKMPARVSSLQRLSHDVMRVLLQLPANDDFAYRPGQYIDIILRDGTRRSYSMAGVRQAGAGLELHLRHMPGGKFTDHVFGAMAEKEILRFEGPFGSFFLREDSDKPIVLLASGTGFAPIKALLEQMQMTGSQRAVTLYWGGRRPADLYMSDWVEQQQQALRQLRYVPVVSDALPEDTWNGRTGLVHQAVLDDFADLSAYQVYACGAPVMVEAARRDFCTLAGLPAEEFYADAFTSEADKH